MFPVLDIKGRVIGFGGRVLDDSKPKYLNSPETSIFNKGNNLYALNFASKGNIDRRMIIVEGYMDVIALHQYGVNSAVASLGTALTKEQAKLIKRYSDEVIISYDADIAGQAATLRGLDILSETGLAVRILNIPKGKDPDEFIRAEGKQAFIECMERAMPLIEYKIKRKSEGFDLSTTEGKIGFVKAASQVLADIDDAVAVDAYITKLSGETNTSASALYDEVRRQRGVQVKDNDGLERHISGKNRYNNTIDGQKLYLEPAYVKAEKFILHILYEMKDYFNTIEKKLPCEDFNDEIYRKTAYFMYEKLRNNESIVPASVISLFDNPEDMKKVSEVFNNEAIIEVDNINKMVEDYINLINKSKLINKKEEILTQIKEFEDKGDVQQSAQLLMKIVEIEKQLRMF
jgi:DNA primase